MNVNLKRLILGISTILFVISGILLLPRNGFIHSLVIIAIFGSATVFNFYFFRRSDIVRDLVAVILFILALFVFFASMSYSLIEEPKESKYVIDDEKEYEANNYCKNKVNNSENDILPDVNQDILEHEEESEIKETAEEKVITKVVEKRVEVPVEKKVTEYVEVPVEVEKKVVEYVEVPVVEYVEVPASTDTDKIQKNEYSYTGDPMNNNYYTGYENNNYGYIGDPTSNSYDYGYGYTGDPTGSSYYNYSSSVKISGPTKVTQGKSYTYTITGVSSVSESKLKLPANVEAEKIGNNKFRLYFEEDYTGSYHIQYGSASISVKVCA